VKLEVSPKTSHPPTTAPVATAVVAVSGVALAFAFPEADVAPLAWVTVAPLLVVARASPTRRALALGAVFGFAFLGTLLIWVSIVGWVAWLALVSFQGASIAAFAGAFSWLARNTGPRMALVAAPFIWVAIDYLRSVVPVFGFTWGQLAQSQHDLLWFIRPAALGGAWFVTFIVVAINALVAQFVLRVMERRAAAAVPVLVACVALIAAPALLPGNVAGGPAINVAIVQGNVPRNWTGAGLEKRQRILEDHVTETLKLAGRDIDLVVWSESAVGIDLDNDPLVAEQIAAAARAVDAPMIVGGDLDAGPDNYQVMAFLISADGEVIDRYRKTHLVPFGEYIPGRPLLEWIPMLDQVPRDAIPGREPVVFDVAGGQVAPVISFEGDFGSLVRGRISHGGRLLVVATNTSTWQESWASAQHVAFSQLRAVENGVGVIHAAVSGISAFVAPDGEVLQSTRLWTRTAIINEMRFAEVITIYARTGDWLPLLSILVTAAVVGRAALRTRRRDEIEVPA
jgi:apolipoprotein N-acyltransferase